mgnify:FL=1
MILSNQPHGYEFKEIKRRLVKKGSYGYAVTELQNYFELKIQVILLILMKLKKMFQLILTMKLLLKESLSY